MAIERYFDLPVVVLSGARGNLPEKQQEIAMKLTPQESCRSFNTLPECILGELDDTLKNNAQEIKITTLKKDLGFSRAEVMEYIGSFSDFHKLKAVEKFSNYSKLGQRIVEEIENTYKETNSSLALSDQLGVALQEADGDLTKAVLGLSLGARAMARGADIRLLPDLEITEDRMLNWKNCIKAFGLGEGWEDTAGDNYHFWHAVLSGMSRQEKTDFFPFRVTKQQVCDFIYERTAWATNFLRYKLCKKEGNTHETIAKLGYSIGRAFMGLYLEK